MEENRRASKTLMKEEFGWNVYATNIKEGAEKYWTFHRERENAQGQRGLVCNKLNKS